MFNQVLTPMASKLGDGSVFYLNVGNEWRYVRGREKRNKWMEKRKEE